MTTCALKENVSSENDIVNTCTKILRKTNWANVKREKTVTGCIVIRCYFVLWWFSEYHCTCTCSIPQCRKRNCYACKLVLCTFCQYLSSRNFSRAIVLKIGLLLMITVICISAFSLYGNSMGFLKRTVGNLPWVVLKRTVVVLKGLLVIFLELIVLKRSTCIVQVRDDGWKESWTFQTGSLSVVRSTHT